MPRRSVSDLRGQASSQPNPDTGRSDVFSSSPSFRPSICRVRLYCRLPHALRPCGRDFRRHCSQASFLASVDIPIKDHVHLYDQTFRPPTSPNRFPQPASSAHRISSMLSERRHCYIVEYTLCPYISFVFSSLRYPDRPLPVINPPSDL